MERLVRIETLAVPLLLDDVDTDLITPMRRILEGPDSMVEHAFEALRFRADGTLDPSCVLNDTRWKGAEILLAGRNFGCGSSRETAVWAVKGMGFRVIVASSFGDIFRSNCFKNGMLPVVLAHAEVAALAEEAKGGNERFTVDLELCRITGPSGRQLSFEINALRREALLDGLDDLALTLRRTAAIKAFDTAYRARRPWSKPKRPEAPRRAPKSRSNDSTRE